MAFALPQSNHTKITGAGSTTTNLSFPGNVTAGNLLIAAQMWDTTNATNIVISQLGTWHQIGSNQADATNGETCSFWYCENSTGGAAQLTATASGGAAKFTGASWVIAEFSGVATSGSLDVSDTTKAFATSTTTADGNTANSITPAGTGELLVAVYHGSAGVAPSITAGTGWTAGPVEPGTAAATSDSFLEWKTGGSGAVTATANSSVATDRYTMQVAAFLASGGATVTVKQLAALGVG